MRHRRGGGLSRLSWPIFGCPLCPLAPSRADFNKSFELGDKLGAGSFSQVFKGTAKGARRGSTTYAIKRTVKKGLDEADEKGLFEEVSLLSVCARARRTPRQTCDSAYARSLLWNLTTCIFASLVAQGSRNSYVHP